MRRSADRVHKRPMAVGVMSRRGLRRALLTLVFGISVYHVSVWRAYYRLVLQPASSPKATESSYSLSQRAQAAAKIFASVPDTGHSLSWLKEYTAWHASIRSNQTSLETAKLLVVSCHGRHAGGIADRLRDLPYFLWEAYQSKRLFLIEWTRPCAIEEFLWPAGLDWRVPEEAKDPDHVVLDYVMTDTTNMIYQQDDLYQRYRVIRTQPNINSFTKGMPFLFQELNMTSVAEIYQLLFVPSPPVQALLDKTLLDLGLAQQPYVAAHLRARYPSTSPVFEAKSRWSRTVDADGVKDTKASIAALKELSNHAIECVLRLQNAKVYFASDTNSAVKIVTSHNDTVVGMVTKLEKFHLDRNDRIGLVRKTPPSAFYEAFVDLLILSRSRCISFGSGGYGLMAASMGGIPCVVLHQRNSVAHVMIKNYETCYANEDL